MQSTRGYEATDITFLEGPNLFYQRPAGVLDVDLRDLPRRGRRGRSIVRQLIRGLSHAAGYERVAVRIRPGERPEHVSVAVPWVDANRIRALAVELDRCLAAVRTGARAPELQRQVAASGQAIAATEPGRAPHPITPSIPVVAVTGTNGKTTTCRALATIARTAGYHVGLTSTSGVFIDDELIQDGDYSGPGGARLVLERPDVDLLIAETARGGILRRGLAMTRCDVAVVTNVSRDHLGLDGITTIDQLAEVKGVVARLARRRGWVVLNADDPRVFAMHQTARAHPWVFTRDPDSPHAREIVDAGGRATTLLDGAISVVERGKAPQPVVALTDLTWTLCGASSANVENALAAATAALALGIPAAEVAEGLRRFRLDQASAKRMNVFSYNGRTVILDMAHNEAGLAALLEACAALRGDGRLLIGVGTGSDRGPQVHDAMGQAAALAADVVAIKHCPNFLEGHSYEEVGQWARTGIERAGKHELGEYRREAGCLDALLAASEPGDLVALTCHEQYGEVTEHLRELGATWDDPATLRRKLGVG